MKPPGQLILARKHEANLPGEFPDIASIYTLKPLRDQKSYFPKIIRLLKVAVQVFPHYLLHTFLGNFCLIYGQ